MKTLEKKYILPALFLAGLLFLLAPNHRAVAASTGLPCTTDAQCPASPQQRCLTDQHLLGPGHCGIGCRNEANCPSGWKCTDIIGEFGLCSEQAAENSCVSDANCIAPQRCLTGQHTLGPGSCGIACRNDAQCPNSWKCTNIIGEFGLCAAPPTASGSGSSGASNGAGGVSGGASIDDLKSQAQATLNRANFSGPADIINRAIKTLMAFIGSLALVLYVYSGFLWMTASGASEQVDKAKKILVWTTLGVVMMLASYVLASFVFKSLGV